MILVAAFMGIVLIGFVALGLDVGLLFREKRMVQTAADAAAMAAAEELASGNAGNEQSVANAIAKLNGFDTTLAKNPATVTLQTPASGNFAGTAYVRAIVSMPIPTYFLGSFNHGFATVQVSAQSIAGGGQTSPTCLCLEGQSGADLNLSNGAKISASGCGIVDDSSSANAIEIIQGSSVSALSLGTVSSSWNNGTNITSGGSFTSSHVVQGITAQCAPPMPAAPAYSSCLPDPGGTSNSFTAGPSSSSGTVCYQSLTVGANGKSDTLNPGTYVISTGNLHFENGSGGHSNLGGNGVFFYLAGTSTLQIDNGANVNLVSGGGTESGGGTAPSIGAYDGVLIYQALGDASGMSLQGGSTAFLSGALYAPSASITLGNGSGSVTDAEIVAQSLIMYGGGTLNAAASANVGSLTITPGKVTQ
jgi:hypothetical protein